MELAAILTARVPLLRAREITEEKVGLTAPEREDYRNQLKECECMLRTNECLFNLETEDTLIDSRIYERSALLCRHRYLVEKLKQR